MNNPLEIRKVVGSVILTLIYVCLFIFIKPSLEIDWVGDGSVTTSLILVIALIGLFVLVFYHILYRSSTETTKLSLTAAFTLMWLALIIFYPFQPLQAGQNDGAVGFFALIGGLAVCVLWVRFFSDEIVA
ncbi:MAG: hypothetical protein NVSMB38_27450 [Ktedonobacteraceae bacterium]